MHHHPNFLRLFWINLAAGIPVVLYSSLFQELFGWTAPPFPGSAFVPLVLASFIFFYGGRVFLSSAVHELRAKRPGMMTLISLAITTAYVYSVGVVVFGGGETLFWELASLIVIMLLGHHIEMRSVQASRGALTELEHLLPDTAELLDGTASKKVPLADLKMGDVLRVRPGERVPADGVVVSGTSSVSEAVITGESAPVAKTPGSEVVGGSVNGDGALDVKVVKIGEETFLAGVMRLVREAEASRSRLQLLSDRAAYWLTVTAIGLGTAAFLAWIFLGAAFSFAVTRLVAVLVIACPHALGLAVPLVTAISTTKAVRGGFLVRERGALESARTVTTVLFDKTGTLTTGEYGVAWIRADDEEELLSLASSLESRSEHPAARAVVKKAKERGVAFSEPESFERVPGRGVRGRVGGRDIFVGGAEPRELEGVGEGQSVAAVREGERLLGLIGFDDSIRAESLEGVGKLQNMGIRVSMITGDSEQAASRVASQLGISEYFARVLPEDKVKSVKALQEKGERVAMVGDGVNDAAALVQADVGIAIGAGTNVAVESADIVLVRNDPRDIARVIRLSKATWRKMLQNLFWAAGYNVAALPLAAGVLAFQGIFLGPATAAVLMSASTVIVAFNALLLQKEKI